MPLRVANTDPQLSEKSLGLQALRDQRWTDAVEHLDLALSAAPDDAEVMNGLALAHSALGDGRKARAILHRAAEVAPGCPEAFTNLAALLVGDGRILEAADHACRALELDPSNAKLITLLEKIRTQIRGLKPAGGRKSRKHSSSHGPTQADLDSRLSRISLVLRRAASAQEVTSSGERPTISLCMIARDEEQFLEECLQSVRGIADEIIVMDTGSTDRTREIARSHGALVHDAEWPDSYAEARNMALEHATGDWILILDADERLDKTSKDAILRAVSSPEADGYALYFRNYMSDGSDPDYFVHRTCRLFRNRPEFRFEGRVHEHVVPSIEAAGGTVSEVEVVVHHYGYRPEIAEGRGKHERYVKLLLADLADKPGDPFCLYNLGAAYSTANDFENARTYLEQAAEVVTPRHEFGASTYSRLAKVLCSIGSPSEALAALDRAESRGIRHPELHFARGNALLLTGSYQDAIGAFRSAIRDGGNGSCIGDQGAFGYKAYYGIAQACMGLGDCRGAVEACQRVLQEKPDDPDATEVLGAALFNLGRHDEAGKHFSRLLAFRPCDARALVRMGDLRRAEGRHQEALEWFSKAVDADPAFADAYFHAADLLTSVGQHPEAADVYQNGLLHDPTNARAFAGLGDCYTRMGAHQAAVLAYRQALAAEPGNAEISARLSAAEDAVAAHRSGRAA